MKINNTVGKNYSRILSTDADRRLLMYNVDLEFKIKKYPGNEFDANQSAQVLCHCHFINSNMNLRSYIAHSSILIYLFTFFFNRCSTIFLRCVICTVQPGDTVKSKF